MIVNTSSLDHSLEENRAKSGNHDRKEISKSSILKCVICDNFAQPHEISSVRSNVRKMRDQFYSIWRCAKCKSLHCETISDYHNLYQEYPLRNQRLDYFLNAWYGVILNRLVSLGFSQKHSLLDYGCGTGLFVKFLRQKGYNNCVGYDPHVKLYNQAQVLTNQYDFVLSLDVIEHDLDPKSFIQRLIDRLNPGGHLCLETPNAEGIILANAEEHIHALHLPYHIHLITPNALKDICRNKGLHQKVIYKKWYMNSWLPGTSRLFFEAYMRIGRNDIDAAFDPLNGKRLLKAVPLFFHFIFGGLIPDRKYDHMMAIFQKSAGKG